MTIPASVQTVINELRQERRSGTNEPIICVNVDLQAALTDLGNASPSATSPDGTVISNISGVAAIPVPNSLSAVLDHDFGLVHGDILYRDATGWKVLAPGASSDILITQGIGANPAWFTLSDIIDSSVGSTQGDIIYRSATGWTVLSPSVAGSLLQNNGAATNPSWSTLGQIAGEPSNGNASAGNIGEYISSTVLVGAAVGLTSGIPVNVTSISLTAGDWDVWGLIDFNPTATTTSTQFIAWISTVSATFPTQPNGGALSRLVGSFGAQALTDLSAGFKRLSLSGTTTVYLSGLQSFAVSTSSAYGFIGARRAR